MDLLIDQSTWVPVLFRSSPVRSIRPRNYTQQQSPVSHRVTVKYRNHTQIPKNHPLDREKTHNIEPANIYSLSTSAKDVAVNKSRDNVIGELSTLSYTLVWLKGGVLV